MIKLIINADDFGLDENRTKAILDGFDRGIVTHTTALATMPYFEKAVKMIRAARYLGHMGFHFNLTEGRALTEAMRNCRFFCDSDGNFTAAFYNVLKYRLRFPSAVRSVVEAEARAQMQCFRDFGGISNHMDSHHHVHTFVSVARILMPIAAEYGFTSFRLSRNLGNDLTLRKRLYKLWFNKTYAHGTTFWSDYMCGFGEVKECVNNIASDSTVEVMVHPMYGSLNNLSMASELTDAGRSMAEDRCFYDSFGNRVRLVYPEVELLRR